MEWKRYTAIQIFNILLENNMIGDPNKSIVRIPDDCCFPEKRGDIGYMCGLMEYNRPIIQFGDYDPFINRPTSCSPAFELEFLQDVNIEKDITPLVDVKLLGA